MDLSSTGSSISKYQLDCVYKKCELVKVKESEVKSEELKESKEIKEDSSSENQMSFINEFKI